MSRNGFPGPKLPRNLLDQVQGGRIAKGQRKDLSRKDRRKQERQGKKTAQRLPRARHERAPVVDEESEEGTDSEPPLTKSQVPKKDAKPAKSILKDPSKTRPELSSDEGEDENEDEDEDEDDAPSAPIVSRAVKAKLEDDDAEIAALEKKLGLKSKKSQKTGDAELDWLVYGSGSEDERSTTKRKRPEDDDWLKNKRRKAGVTAKSFNEEHEDVLDLDSDDDSQNEELEALEGDSEQEEISGDDENEFEAFEDEDDEDNEDNENDENDSLAAPAPVKQKENPYVAPVSKEQQATKYVPPSLRKPAGTDEEVLKQLRRQIQGQLNRLSEANLLSILQAIQDIYTKNARQHVTSMLIELLLNMVCDPSVLNDTFLVLHAGFAAALYRTAGIDFGAQLLESIVQSFDAHYESGSEAKQALNLIAFLSNLYAFQVVGSEIMFDYIRMLLDKRNFSENSTELLLRVIRMTGTQLRQDDPSALKDIVLLLQRTTSALGEANVSVRTKFMIETIHDLKNNRMKTGLAASALTAEHMQRMKKTLGTLKNAKTTEPLRMSLNDIRESDKKGKWWLVGASWKDPAKMVDNTATTASSQQQSDDVNDDEASDGEVDLQRLARDQGMNTDVRRAIFVALTGAVDYQHAHLRIMKLNLKNKQLLEVPRVLVHCVGAEPVYNHYYTLVATKFCGDHKLRKAYQFALLDVFRRMGETKDDDEDDDDQADATEEMSVRKIFNIAKMFATLIAQQLLRLTILKPLDFASLKSKTTIFVDSLLTTTFLTLRKIAHKNGFETAVKDILSQAHAVPDIVPGLKFYLADILPQSEVIANKKEKKIVDKGCEYAIEALADHKRAVPVEEDLSDEDH